MATPYCPHCRTAKPMMKAGHQLMVGGRPSKQRYQCRNRGCYRMTTKPLWRKPYTKKGGK